MRNYDTLYSDNTNKPAPKLASVPMGDCKKVYDKVNIFYMNKDVTHQIDYVLGNLIRNVGDKKDYIGYVDKGSVFLKPLYEARWKKKEV
jgi:hypothetical protein